MNTHFQIRERYRLWEISISIENEPSSSKSVIVVAVLQNPAGTQFKVSRASIFENRMRAFAEVLTSAKAHVDKVHKEKGSKKKTKIKFKALRY